MSKIEILSIIEIVLSGILIVLILLQQGDSGLGTVFGGSGGESYRSKRGVEALFFRGTIFTIILFVVNALAIAILSSK